MDKNNRLEQLFRSAKEQKPVHSFDEAKDQFINSLNYHGGGSGTKKMKFLFTKKWIIMFVTVSILTSVFFVINSDTDGSHLNENVAVQSNKSLELEDHEQFSFKDEFPEIVDKLKPLKKHSSVEDDSFTIDYIDVELIADDTTSLYPSVDRTQENSTQDDEYIFPKLTEEEIAANHKQKKSMLKALEKFDKKEYSYIPSGTFDFNGKKVSVQAFYIQKKEVTNLEYRTFLFDLLIQDRKNEFLIAKPNQALWSKLFVKVDNPMEELYFSHPAYNEYPVVNISREGVELYCKWLSQELFKYVGETKKSNYNDLRLPVREEWVKAASAEGKQLPYPWEGQFLRNEKGCYLANLKPTDSTYIDDGGFYTVKVNSYTMNQHGLYNMSGNVAEMVYDNIQLKTPGTAGGGWMNNPDELKIYGPDPYKGMTDAHPNIGFRVVMTYNNK